MPLLVWDAAQFATDVALHDEEHKQLVALLNDLHGQVTRVGRDVVGAALDDLIGHLVAHFASEEQTMASAGYAELELHRIEHDKLLRLCFDLQCRFRCGRAEVNERTTAFLRDWMVDHMSRADRAYGEVLAPCRAA